VSRAFAKARFTAVAFVSHFMHLILIFYIKRNSIYLILSEKIAINHAADD